VLTAEQRRQFHQADSDLDALTVERLLDLLTVLTVTDARDFTAGVMDTLPALVAELGEVSALIGSTMYETARDQSDARGRFTVNLSDPPNTEQVQATARWALAPLFSPENVLGPAELTGLLTARLSAGAPRLVREGGRRTIVDNTARDPARPRYRRVLSAGKKTHCDFCTMLAGRGFVYHTKDTAGAGKHFHDRCGCGLELGFN